MGGQASDNVGYQQPLRFPWNRRALGAPSVLSRIKLVVLVTVSRLWLGVTYYASLGISGVQQDPPNGPQKDLGQGGAGPSAMR